MVIIKTKFLAPTNSKGSRIKAEAQGWSVTIPYPPNKSFELAHYEAVKALIQKHNLEWDISNMGFGSDATGYYFTFSTSVISEV